jgi:hypothetical protein
MAQSASRKSKTAHFTAKSVLTILKFPEETTTTNQ